MKRDPRLVLAVWCLGIGLAASSTVVVLDNVRELEPQTGLSPRPMPKSAADAVGGGLYCGACLYIVAYAFIPTVTWVLESVRRTRIRRTTRLGVRRWGSDLD